uniref:BRCT domain-containing protein n=1 Tax=Kalanchoe fedtschenkoi TaxID=63787 RepID=A0A7N1A5H3_KALFE
MMMDDNTGKSADFIVECHGIKPKYATATRTTVVSSHWVRCCLQVRRLPFVSSVF